MLGCTTVEVLLYSVVKTSVCIFSGDVKIPVNISFTLHSALNETSPQFTLTCISTGGPATTVTWTRTTADFGVVTIQNMTLLNNILPRYIHTLNVSGRLRGTIRMHNGRELSHAVWMVSSNTLQCL